MQQHLILILDTDRQLFLQFSYKFLFLEQQQVENPQWCLIIIGFALDEGVMVVQAWSTFLGVGFGLGEGELGGDLLGEVMGEGADVEFGLLQD